MFLQECLILYKLFGMCLIFRLIIGLSLLKFLGG